MTKQLMAYIFAGLIALCGTAYADVDHWKVSDLMKVPAHTMGYGLTTFEGDTPSEFNVEALGMVPHGEAWLLLVRLSDKDGKNILESAHVYHGISGSPVYFDGKLVGAVAYAVDWEKEAIGFVTPFENSYKENQGRRVVAKMAEAPKDVVIGGKQYALKPLMAFDTVLRATPRGTAEVHTVAQPNNKFCPGCAVSVGIVTGDLTLAGSGTITAVDGDTIYAFGHPMLGGAGIVSYPAWRTSVLTVLPSTHSSFFYVGNFKGDEATIEYDGTFGVYGTIGKTAEMIPVDLNVTVNGATKSLHCNVVYGQIAVEALQRVAATPLVELKELMGDVVLEFNGSIAPRGFSSVNTHEYYGRGAYDEMNIFQQFLSAVGTQYFANLQALFQAKSDLKIDKLTLSFKIIPGLRQTLLEKAWLRSPEVVACGSLSLEFLLLERGLDPEAVRYTKTIELEIPESAQGRPGGTVTITSGKNLQPTNFDDLGDPSTLEDVIRRMN
ncbi:MAG: hypothetical protein Q7S28_04445 [bacterium]|nr:hypothetical protein [bacterium]